jgi:hypothetical protein
MSIKGYTRNQHRCNFYVYAGNDGVNFEYSDDTLSIDVPSREDFDIDENIYTNLSLSLRHELIHAWFRLHKINFLPYSLEEFIANTFGACGLCGK